MKQLVMVGCNATPDVHSLVASHDLALLIEPQRDVCDQLYARYREIHGVEIECCAIGMTNGVGQMHVYNDGLSTSFGTVTPQARQMFADADFSRSSLLPVQIRRLPNLLNSLRIQFVDTMVIDAQGYDVLIVETLIAWLAGRQIGRLQIEVNAAGFQHYEGLPNREADAMRIMAEFPHYRLVGRSGVEWQPDLTWELITDG